MNFLKKEIATNVKSNMEAPSVNNIFKGIARWYKKIFDAIVCSKIYDALRDLVSFVQFNYEGLEGNKKGTSPKDSPYSSQCSLLIIIFMMLLQGSKGNIGKKLVKVSATMPAAKYITKVYNEDIKIIVQLHTQSNLKNSPATA